MIIQFSTGGRGREHSERGKMLGLKPHMASLATGSVNFPAQIYENPPQLVDDLARAMLQYDVKPEIEVFDVAMLYNAKMLADRGLLKRPCARHQLEVNRWCLELGGHVRTGLEDNIKFDKDRLARSNAELVARLAGLCGEYGRHAASCAEARQLLGLPAA
jgi:uncharacterized protein (DUF849 family)